jgi:spore maturation protein CgeB
MIAREMRFMKNQSGNKSPIHPWWDYPKFRSKQVNVLLVNLKHLLLSEISNALLRLGHRCKVLLIGREEADRDDVEKTFVHSIRSFRPDFILTINHSGFDQEGFVTDLLSRYKIPFASWYVDSPYLILHHYARNKSPYLTLFLWDKDYIEVVSKLGFDQVEYLPLGVDEMLFQPLQEEGNHLAHLASNVSFVGNSMVIKVRSILGRNKIKGSLLDRFEEVSTAFQLSDHLIVRDMIKEQFPNLASELAMLPGPMAFGYETGVTWQATGWYRLGLLERLKPFNPLIVGDPGWEEILGNGFQRHRELNYYNDLPAFYNVSQISFNATSRQMKEGVNQRVFDVPACRRVVVTDWTRQLEQVMEPGKEILAYRKGDDISELVNQALRDEDFRRKIAEAGYRRVLGEHTYCHRLEQMINVMKRNHG